jgi:predicted nucleotidyltransferase
MEVHARHHKALDEFLRRAVEGYGERIERIILFGSVARGEAKPGSDIDILVIWRGDKVEGWDALEGIATDILLKYEKLISLKILYPEGYHGMLNIGASFIQAIENEGVVLGYHWIPS